MIPTSKKDMESCRWTLMYTCIQTCMYDLSYCIYKCMCAWEFVNLRPLMFLLCMYAATLPLSIVPDLRAADEFIEGNILHSAQRLSADMPASYHAADSNIGVPSPCMYSSMYVCMYVCMYQCIYLIMYVSRWIDVGDGWSIGWSYSSRPVSWIAHCHLHLCDRQTAARKRLQHTFIHIYSY